MLEVQIAHWWVPWVVVAPLKVKNLFGWASYFYPSPEDTYSQADGSQSAYDPLDYLVPQSLDYLLDGSKDGFYPLGSWNCHWDVMPSCCLAPANFRYSYADSHSYCHSPVCLAPPVVIGVLDLSPFESLALRSSPLLVHVLHG